MEKIKLLIADDHNIIRDGIKLMLKKNDDIEIIGDVNNGKEAIKYIEENHDNIDVVLMDINMPEMDGIEATKYINENYKNVNVLALTMHTEESFITSMLKAGALGYVLKESGTDELIRAIKATSNGDKYYSNDVSVTMINALMNGEKPKSTILSDRESEVLKHISEGLTNKEVGIILHISGRTVETHRRNILAKLELDNSAQLIRYAIENNIINSNN